ncbi:MAG TPA: hypothetical protein VJ860_20255 [Polyangia bacterium]|jgi:FecR protein.|nr:hypothetical protein [Polyangia bacterium]
MKLRGRRPTSPFQVAVIVLVAVILVGATLLSRFFFERRRTEMPAGLPSPAPRLPLAQPAQFRVSALAGTVEAFQNGQWYVARAGHLLSSKDVVRTHGGSHALLRRGSVEIDVRDNMDLRLDKLEETTTKLGLLREGRVSANVGRDDEKLEIQALDTRTTNVGAARFAVSLAPSGKVSVTAAEGAARFEAHGKRVVVRKGNESTAFPGAVPSDPEPIPEQLLLSVVWPEDDKAEPVSKIRGRASPSSRVRVNGEETPVAPDGTFLARVQVSEPKTRVHVEAEDVTGRQKTVDKILRPAPRAPSLQTSGDELWKE